MKTLTEFSAFNLRDANQKAKEISDALKAEGKPAEEADQAKKETLNAYLAEKYKLEGDKLNLFLAALEIAQAKPNEIENLKRIVVYTLNEGEKVPGTLIQRESHAFGAEYLRSLRPQRQDRRSAGSKHAKGKGKGRGKRRGDLKGKRPDGGNERRGANATPGETKPRPEGGRDQRRDRKGRGPRPPRKDLPPGHISVDQAARHAAKSTGIRPVEKPQAVESTKSSSEIGN
ncbi:hypothetical protein EBZ37_03050 [bacterium]|nr:hypothetical protein [bacterium]